MGGEALLSNDGEFVAGLALAAATLIRTSSSFNQHCEKSDDLL
jgi:hypothetical protein